MRSADRGRGGAVHKRLFACVLLAVLFNISAIAKAGPVGPEQDQAAQLQGQPVRHILFEGIAAERIAALEGKLPQKIGAPLDSQKIADSLRELFATGLFDAVDVSAEQGPDGITVIFQGKPRMFIGRVTVAGAKGGTVNTQLERAARLNPGTRLTKAKMAQAEIAMRTVLAQNGYNEPTIKHEFTEHSQEQLTDIAFQIVSGPRARIGDVTVTGDPGMTVAEFRSLGKLKAGAAVDRDTVSRALTSILKHYRKQKHLEAEIKLESQEYAAHRVNYRFTANRGRVVKVVVEGASLSDDHIEKLVPVFEEGTVDDDLLNEGNRRIRNYFQSLGYFDVKVDHQTSTPPAGEVLIAFNVNLGPRRSVEKVLVDGNHYFSSATLEDLLSVHSASSFDRHGAYSQALVSSDVAALEAVYKNNGFSDVKVTPETLSGAPPPGSPQAPPPSQDPASQLRLVYHIQEGQQQRVGSLLFEGNDHLTSQELASQLNTESGQLLSAQNLAADRDTLASQYVSKGFDQVRVEVEQTTEAGDTTKADVTFRITEGPQIFVRNVLMTGLHYTRPQTVAKAITIKPGDPLNQQAMEETQRNMYDFGLFSEINMAVQNPNGGETQKTILLQATEARRWTFTYGGGFEVQTGTPVNGCQGYLAIGITTCTPEGKTGVSPRVLGALTRNNLFGREQSASISGNYGLLEQKIDLIYQSPHFLGSRNFGFTFTGGYANSQTVTTYVASRLEAGFRVSQTYSRPGSALLRANTFIYSYDFRRVKVALESLQVYPSLLTPLSSATRVGGPSITWVRDTRDSPVDSHRGTYTSFSEFISAAPFGAEAHFNRIDMSNSSYYGFDKDRWVIARNTRYGQERAFGTDAARLLPLPERLFSGGATSLRGFSINAAGPRDPDTGFPIGGAGALVNSTELRLPPTPLPYLGNALSFVIFHDMGNIFNNSSDVWPSLLRTSQPDRDKCKILTKPIPNPNPPPPEILPEPSGPEYSTGKSGQCRFDYFAQIPGLGMRYHTPVGPIRLDFSYNLNPPIYPVNVDYGLKEPFSDQHVGAASHFNFFFSLGQTF
ncbi:POTRA domain-containing protein [Occallatibacter riparius]|uniref:BamA/TamA family outer membrane protein n=1 Tax=Occallatibacter riparius TaxID=1002689 RepID=A0A9J7BME8_9BACT|nr:POTRA domain-containing protein [Occallatibacter riparius]UWZ83851.1 BamA/TamA family outer membrane protein [Occallatibacter riparius]